MMVTSLSDFHNVYNKSVLPEELLNKLVDKDKVDKKTLQQQKTISSVYFSDDIVSTWFLTSGPVVPFIVATYLFSIKLGMHLMKSRQPFNVTMAIRIYNIFQILFNVYMITSAFKHYRSIIVLIRSTCAVDLQEEDISEMAIKFLHYFYGFLFSKITDLLDTMFMVLRKKNSHITFLHVYHHSGMVLFTWISLKYAKAFQAAFPGFINVFVHIIMYTYYFLATFGPTVQKYLWWKKHLTKLQLAQFFVVLVYLSTLYYYNCPISWIFIYIWIFNTVVFTCLFLNFYIKAYLLNSSNKANGSSKTD